jgi:hypothetical protein
VKPAIGGYPHGMSSVCSSFVLFGRAKAVPGDTGKPLVPNKLISEPDLAGRDLENSLQITDFPGALG